MFMIIPICISVLYLFLARSGRVAKTAAVELALGSQGPWCFEVIGICRSADVAYD